MHEAVGRSRRETTRDGAGSPDHAGAANRIEHVRLAQAAWDEAGLAARLALVRRARHLIAASGKGLAEAALRERGQLVAEKLVTEVIPLADACRFLEREAARILRPRRYGRRGRPVWLMGATSEVHREPCGVVLVIAPSNYPLLLAGVQTMQALVAGNAVLWKPGTGGGPAARAFVELLRRAGLPEHLVTVLSEEPRAAASAIAEGVDKVVLTGSAETGRAVLAGLAPGLVPSVLELSGCDSVFVLEGADLDLVAAALDFGLRLNGGRTCLAPRRVFVAEALSRGLEVRLEGLAGRREPIRIDPGRADGVRALLDDALRLGGRRIAPRTPDDGPLAGPLIVADARPEMRLMREEAFGPIVALMSVIDADEALRIDAHCPYALGSSIFGPTGPAAALARRVRAGVVVINDMIAPTADPRLPFGGRGRSGHGVTRGAEGLLELTNVKVVVRRSGRFRPHYDPLGACDEAMAEAYLSAAHGPTRAGRLASALRLGGILMRRGGNRGGAER